MIDFSLTDEQKALQQRARDFAQNEIAPAALQYDKEPDFPTEIMHKAHKIGFMNLTCPEEYGGQGLGLLDAALVTEELNAGCSGIAGMIGINSLACGKRVWPILPHHRRIVAVANSAVSCVMPTLTQPSLFAKS